MFLEDSQYIIDMEELDDQPRFEGIIFKLHRSNWSYSVVKHLVVMGTESYYTIGKGNRTNAVIRGAYFQGRKIGMPR